VLTPRSQGDQRHARCTPTSTAKSPTPGSKYAHLSRGDRDSTVAIRDFDREVPGPHRRCSPTSTIGTLDASSMEAYVEQKDNDGNVEVG
jgi:hypothetical protein